MVDRSNFFFDFGVYLSEICIFISFALCLCKLKHFDGFDSFKLPANQPVDIFFLFLPGYSFLIRVLRAEEMHIELLFKHVLLI